jgi:hypothetical protein
MRRLGYSSIVWRQGRSVGYEGAGRGAWTRCEGSQPVVTSQLRRCYCVKRGRCAGLEQITITAAGRISLTAGSLRSPETVMVQYGRWGRSAAGDARDKARRREEVPASELCRGGPSTVTAIFGSYRSRHKVSISRTSCCRLTSNGWRVIGG